MGGSDVHGLITYMRTDSPRISSNAQKCRPEHTSKPSTAQHIDRQNHRFTKRLKALKKRTKRSDHPDVTLTPEKAKHFLTGHELKLYSLIWERFVASQMSPASINVTTIKIGAGDGHAYEFRATGSEVVFMDFSA